VAEVFKYLDIENHELISDKLYQYVLTHTDILKNKIYWNTLDLEHVLEHVPELKTTLNKIIHSRIVLVAIFYTPPGFSGGAHIDAGPLEHRVLWPVHNCKGSYTKFFDLNGNQLVEKMTDGNDPYYLVEGDNPLIEIASAETTKPLVLHVKSVHGIYTNQEYTQPRLTATIGFFDPIGSYLE
jgi:hypothetical protein